jgi:hypothetical protein
MLRDTVEICGENLATAGLFSSERMSGFECSITVQSLSLPARDGAGAQAMTCDIKPCRKRPCGPSVPNLKPSILPLEAVSCQWTSSSTGSLYGARHCLRGTVHSGPIGDSRAPAPTEFSCSCSDALPRRPSPSHRPRRRPDRQSATAQPSSGPQIRAAGRPDRPADSELRPGRQYRRPASMS